MMCTCLQAQVPNACILANTACVLLLSDCLSVDHAINMSILRIVAYVAQHATLLRRLVPRAGGQNMMTWCQCSVGIVKSRFATREALSRLHSLADMFHPPVPPPGAGKQCRSVTLLLHLGTADSFWTRAGIVTARRSSCFKFRASTNLQHNKHASTVYVMASLHACADVLGDLQAEMKDVVGNKVF